MNPIVIFLMQCEETNRGYVWDIFTMRKGENRGRWSRFTNRSVACRRMEQLADKYGVTDRAGLYAGQIIHTGIK
jgi:hypothetical protein